LEGTYQQKVTPILEGGSFGYSLHQKCELFVKLTPEQKATVAKYFAENGVRNLNRFIKEHYRRIEGGTFTVQELYARRKSLVQA